MFFGFLFFFAPFIQSTDDSFTEQSSPLDLQSETIENSFTEKISPTNPPTTSTGGSVTDQPSPTNPPPPSPSPTALPTFAGHPPSAAVVWVTSIAGVAVIGCTVLILCIKKQPDDMLFDTYKDHMNNIANLNTIQTIQDNEAINTPLMFTPEGSLN